MKNLIEYVREGVLWKITILKNIRKKLHVSQSKFAYMIGVSIDTLQNWEQGRRNPEGPALALLKVAETDPETVMKALHS